MNIGLNLSFAVKRWLVPDVLANMCNKDFGINNVQLTWDLINPWWPEKERKVISASYIEAFDRNCVSIDSTFGGLASYTYANFLAPTLAERSISIEHFRRAIDLTSELKVKKLGTPIGGMDYYDARNKDCREKLYKDMITILLDLAKYAKKKGIDEILIEAVPLWTEIPYNIETSLQLMKDLEKGDVKFSLLLDWGHALYKPLLKEEADMNMWLTKCKNYVGAIHLQQTDGFLDRHWDFTKDGIVNLQSIKKHTKKAGIENIYQYLEVIYPFEEEDDIVYQNVKKSIQLLHDL